MTRTASRNSIQISRLRLLPKTHHSLDGPECSHCADTTPGNISVAMATRGTIEFIFLAFSLRLIYIGLVRYAIQAFIRMTTLEITWNGLPILVYAVTVQPAPCGSRSSNSGSSRLMRTA